MALKIYLLNLLTCSLVIDVKLQENVNEQKCQFSRKSEARHTSTRLSSNKNITYNQRRNKQWSADVSVYRVGGCFYLCKPVVSQCSVFFCQKMEGQRWQNWSRVIEAGGVWLYPFALSENWQSEDCIWCAALFFWYFGTWRNVTKCIMSNLFCPPLIF